MNEPHIVGINDAARLTGKNKATISRDTTLGRISATINEAGHKRYMVAELERYYGQLRTPDTSATPGKNHRNQPAPAPADTGVITEVVKAKDEVIELLKSQVEDLRRERDNWREQAIRALPAPVATTPAPGVEPGDNHRNQPPLNPTETANTTKPKRGLWPFRRRVTA